MSTHVMSLGLPGHAAPEAKPRWATRAATFAYGAASYAIGVGSLVYAIGFVGNWLVPKGIDSGAPGPMTPSLLVNSALLLALVVQHTVMARPAFKRWVTRFIPAAVERSTFVLVSGLIMVALFWLWQPAPRVVWRVHGAAAWALTALSLLGWGVAFGSTFLINHFDLFGLRQVWLRLRAREYRPVRFRLAGFYRVVRHPLMLGFLIAFWATPLMSVGHLFFAIMMTAYIFMGTRFEERDLVREHGEAYLAYRRKVRGFVPLPKG
jgi:protein-S-isoprenylcysteine O-methyltransferase Ste14